MHALAVLAAAVATWSAPQTVSSPHTFVGPLYASSSLVAWDWQDGVGQTTGAGASQAAITAAGASLQHAAPAGLVAARPYDGGSVLLANRELDSRGTRWRLTVTDG